MGVTLSGGGRARAGSHVCDLPARTPFDKEADTFLGLFLGGLAACVGNPWDGLYFTLADGGWVEGQLWWPGETHGQPCRTHEDPSDSWKGKSMKEGLESQPPDPPPPQVTSSPPFHQHSHNSWILYVASTFLGNVSIPSFSTASFAFHDQFCPNSSCPSNPTPHILVCLNQHPISLSFYKCSPYLFHCFCFSTFSWGLLLPAKAGLTGLDPLRFFTGTVGTLKKERTDISCF